jgi:hypothetical protein
MEVFMTEWNKRKQQQNELKRATTIQTMCESDAYKELVANRSSDKSDDDSI